MIARLRAAFDSFPQILFLHGRLASLTLCAALLLRPTVALAGLIAVLAAYVFARLLQLQDEFAASGAHVYNPLLVGLSVGCLFELTPVTVGLAMAAGLLAFTVTTLLGHAFRTHLNLPVLSLPFVAVSAIIYLAAIRYSGVLPMGKPVVLLGMYEPNMPLWLAGYLKSFGAILFAPSVTVGLVFGLVVLYCSRILFLLSVLGYAAGTAFHALLLGSSVQAVQDLAGCNFILIAMALGGVFLVPSLRSYLLAVLAAIASTLVLDAVAMLESYAGIRLFILPFNIVTLSAVYVLAVVRSPLLAWLPGRTPEETLDDHLANRLRYPGQPHTLFLPFTGVWMVWQAFDGKWTHKGRGRYAYDFVIADDAGRTFTDDGIRLDDYYAFRKPVLSPVRGYVVGVDDSYPDNPPGRVHEVEHEGNRVTLQDPRGFFVKLCHFAAGSIRVKKGQWVERGHVLGLCGNSGFSPQPHIHLQVQASDAAGAATQPFSFAGYVDGQLYCANDVPAEGHPVEPLHPDKRLVAVTNFVLDEEYAYEVRKAGQLIGELTMQVRMAADGTLYFESERGKLYFGCHEGTFYFYRAGGDDPWLRLLFLAMPRLPLTSRAQLSWHDHVPVGLATHGLKRAAVRFFSSFYPALARIRVTQSFAGARRVRARIESRLLGVHTNAEVVLDRKKGFAAVSMGDIELRRVECTKGVKRHGRTTRRYRLGLDLDRSSPLELRTGSSGR